MAEFSQQMRSIRQASYRLVFRRPMSVSSAIVLLNHGDATGTANAQQSRKDYPTRSGIRVRTQPSTMIDPVKQIIHGVVILMASL